MMRTSFARGPALKHRTCGRVFNPGLISTKWSALSRRLFLCAVARGVEIDPPALFLIASAQVRIPASRRYRSHEPAQFGHRPTRPRSGAGERSPANRTLVASDSSLHFKCVARCVPRSLYLPGPCGAGRIGLGAARLSPLRGRSAQIALRAMGPRASIG